jgi:hypothetical protein
MLVERLLVCIMIDILPTGGHANAHKQQESDKSLYKPTLEQIKDSIKTSTSSMTAVPKPLKFLRPHYEKLEEAYQSWPQGDDKVRSLPSSARPCGWDCSC